MNINRLGLSALVILVCVILLCLYLFFHVLMRIVFGQYPGPFAAVILLSALFYLIVSMVKRRFRNPN